MLTNHWEALRRSEAIRYKLEAALKSTEAALVAAKGEIERLRKQGVVVTVLHDDELPAAGAYLAGSVTDGSAIVKLNLGMMALGSCDESMSESITSFRAAFAETLAHELLHVCQEIAGKAFSEEEVERAISQARAFLADNADAIESVSADELIGQQRDELASLRAELEATQAKLKAIEEAPYEYDKPWSYEPKEKHDAH